MKKTFTKKDLRNGDIVVTRSGEPGVVILDKEIILYRDSGFDFLDMFTEDLMSDDDERQCDIMEVYQDSGVFGFLDIDDMIPVFEREDDDTSVTTEQESTTPESVTNVIPEPKEEFTSQRKSILITAQAFYGNRTITSIREEEMDRFILGILDASLPLFDEKIDRTLIPVPGTDNLFLVYNRYQEEKEIRCKDQLLKEEGIKLHPLAIIPEMDIVLYSRCIVCRMNENGEYEDLEDDDFIKFMQYLRV